MIDVAYNQKDCRSLSWVNGFLSDTENYPKGYVWSIAKLDQLETESASANSTHLDVCFIVLLTALLLFT